MFKERRTAETSAPATNPSMWAENFARSRQIDWYRSAAFKLDHRWALIRQHLAPGVRVLDAGCGAGEWVAFLNERGFQAEGLDYSPELIERVRTMYPHYRWQTGLIQEMPYESGTFDAVISWGVIEHDEEGPERALAEFKRILKPGGALIVTVPVDTPRQRHASRVQFPETLGGDGARFFQYFMTPQELSAFVSKVGLTVVDAGLQRSPALALLWPELSTRTTRPLRHGLNKIVRTCLWWHRGIMNMTYCIGRLDR